MVLILSHKEFVSFLRGHHNFSQDPFKGRVVFQKFQGGVLGEQHLVLTPHQRRFMVLVGIAVELGGQTVSFRLRQQRIYLVNGRRENQSPVFCLNLNVNETVMKHHG